MTDVKKIAIIGAESTGKSTLCEELAGHFQTCFTTEFARDYLPTLHRDYTEEDLMIIAREQMQREEEAIKQAYRFLFCDTDIMNIRVWSEVKFGKCSRDLLLLAASQDYDMYFLLLPELPWKEDPLRENPDQNMRNKLTQYYLEYALLFEKPIYTLGKENRPTTAIERIKEKFLLTES